MGSTPLDQNLVQGYRHSKIKIKQHFKHENNNNYYVLSMYIHHVYQMHRLVEHCCPDVHIIGAKHLSAVWCSSYWDATT